MSNRFVVSSFSFWSPCFFKSLRFLPLFSHEYLSNCYNWALIKLETCFPMKRLDHIGLAMFTQMHELPPPILLNYGVYPQQQAIFGNTHHCNSTTNTKEYNQHTFNHKLFIMETPVDWLMLNSTTNWTNRTEGAEFLRCVIIHCCEPEAFGTEKESVGGGRRSDKDRHGI